MPRRRQFASLAVLSAAVVAGAGVFLLVGRMAGGFYAAAALIFGLFVHQKLTRSADVEPMPETPEEEMSHDRDAEPRRRIFRRRRAALEFELAQARAEARQREAAIVKLAGELEEQQARTRTLQASFAERLSGLTETVDDERARQEAASADHSVQLAAVRAELGQALAELSQRDAMIAGLNSELAASRERSAELADRLADVTAARKTEYAQLVSRWRLHAEEIPALEAALEAALRARPPGGARQISTARD